MESFILTIPEALAIVGSVASVVLGAFGYLLKIRRDEKQKDKAVATPAEFLEHQVQGAHDRISEMKDRLTHAEGEIKLTVTKLEAIRQTMIDHDKRDDQDHELFEKKLDKLMDILIKILTDDKM